jgi:hypothetical protein
LQLLIFQEAEAAGRELAGKLALAVAAAQARNFQGFTAYRTIGRGMIVHYAQPLSLGIA